MKIRPIILALAALIALIWLPLRGGQAENRWQDLETSLAAYRRVAEQVRAENGGGMALPAVDFFLFGMGDRTKYIYRDGKLIEAFTGKVVRTWDVTELLISPSRYTVALKTPAGEVFISEDEQGVWITAGNKREALATSPLRLPSFDKNPYGEVLKVLHHEVLINFRDGAPVPNLFVYPKPWYRDGAIVGMVLKESGNLRLIKGWVTSLSDPYDRLNGGFEEADNLGELLFLISLVSTPEHPLVKVILAEARKLTKDGHIEGITDFEKHPVYQTEWLKLGLRSLKLPDPYTVPAVNDPYASLAWWGTKSTKGVVTPFTLVSNFPYLEWASAHYVNGKGGQISFRDYPLTWEAQGGSAAYADIRPVSPAYADAQLAPPHSWHAAEVFLYLLSKGSGS